MLHISTWILQCVIHVRTVPHSPLNLPKYIFELIIAI